MTRSDLDIAEELEAELDEYPEERGEILLEAADHRRRAGDHDRAIELLTEAIAMGGEEGENAHVGMAEVLFELGRDDQARTQLDELRRGRPTSPTPCLMAAELLEERGDLEQALTWFNMAVSRLTEEELAGLDAELGFLSYATGIVAGRRRVRDALGLPPDELDEKVADHAERARDFLTPPAPRELRVLFWPRPEIPRAHELWPELVEHTDVDAIMAEREAGNRELSEDGVGRITMVPLTTAKLVEFAERTGRDPMVEETRVACLAEIVEEGGTVQWPPGRNEPCWCGSARKYKKCCGRPG